MLTHTLSAVFCLALAIGSITMISLPDAEAIEPKLLGTVLAFVVPAVGGHVIAKMQQNIIARYVWFSGLVFFSIVCVWVLDLPTGPGLCEKCGALDNAPSSTSSTAAA